MLVYAFAEPREGQRPERPRAGFVRAWSFEEAKALAPMAEALLMPMPPSFRWPGPARAHVYEPVVLVWMVGPAV
ncbi:MAG: hypothetical protein ACFBWO_10935 [Paracoccaceae bacterium]